MSKKKIMRTLLLQVATPEIDCYAKHSKRINYSYTQKHGYDYACINFVSPKRHPAWGKVESLIAHLKDYDRVFVLDADAFVNNHSISLDSFSSGKCISVCRNDENGGELLNTGSMIFLNSEITYELINRWYGACENTPQSWNYFWEQTIFNSLHNDGSVVPIEQRFADNTAIYESRRFNSWWLDITHNYKSEQFVQHIMARPNHEKETLICEYAHILLSNQKTKP